MLTLQMTHQSVRIVILHSLNISYMCDAPGGLSWYYLGIKVHFLQPLYGYWCQVVQASFQLCVSVLVPVECWT